MTLDIDKYRTVRERISQKAALVRQAAREEENPEGLSYTYDEKGKLLSVNRSTDTPKPKE